MNSPQPLTFSSEPSSREEDERLLRSAQEGDGEAFGELVQRHEARVWRVARGLVGSDDDAQDIAQEAFLRAYRGMQRFDFQYAFSTWLYRIVTNLCIDWLRKRRRHQSLSLPGEDEGEDHWHEVPDPSESLPSDALVAAETAGEVRAILDGLAPHFRTALVLRELEGLSCKEIADIVGATHVTVRWRLHRGRKLFLDAWKRAEAGAAAGALVNDPELDQELEPGHESNEDSGFTKGTNARSEGTSTQGFGDDN